MDQALDARVRRYTPVGALLIIDVDHFRQINDRFGHSAGDRILVGVARILQNRVRDTDVLAGLSGDEFAILMTEGGQPEAQTLASDLSDLVRRRAIVLEGGAPGGITVSIGIAVFDDRDDLSASDVLSDADAALYTAKPISPTAGRSRSTSPAARSATLTSPLTSATSSRGAKPTPAG